MGSFSFTFASKSRCKYVNFGEGDNIKVLIPEQFGGGSIVGEYQDYGRVETEDKEVYDLFELLAIWNVDHWRLHLSNKDSFSKITNQKMDDGGEETEHNRGLGITYGTYERDVNRLEYPLKIVSQTVDLKYEEVVGRSYTDPEQGWVPYTWSSAKYKKYFPASIIEDDEKRIKTLNVVPKVIKTNDHTVPFFDNERTLPYATLEVTDAAGPVARVKVNETPSGEQYITYKRAKYPVVNTGSLYSPNWVIKVDSENV